ncbi:ORF5 [Jasmine virus A-1]|nr:ORF5 [Jasmine virus A-1]WMX21267.1 capsid protein [Jasmine virus A-1]
MSNSEGDNSEKVVNDDKHEDGSEQGGEDRSDIRGRANDVGSVEDIFSRLGARDDVLNSEQLEPDKLKDISVSASRGDILNDKELKEFEQALKKYCRIIIGAEPDETHFSAFVLSMTQAALNQSTSTKNERQYHLVNTFSVGGKEYEWYTAKFISFLRGNFSNIANSWRRYMRAIEGQVQIMISTGKIMSDGHLAAKHGTTSQFWNATSDFTNGCRTNISDDDLSANYLQREIATKKSNKVRTIYNVSQLASNVN